MTRLFISVPPKMGHRAPERLARGGHTRPSGHPPTRTSSWGPRTPPAKKRKRLCSVFPISVEAVSAV